MDDAAGVERCVTVARASESSRFAFGVSPPWSTVGMSMLSESLLEEIVAAHGDGEER
jgi:hypothetical protein